MVDSLAQPGGNVTGFMSFEYMFLQELKHLGWAEGRNVRIEMRASAGNISAARKYAAELVAFAPDVILAVGGSTIAPLLEAPIHSLTGKWLDLLKEIAPSVTPCSSASRSSHTRGDWTIRCHLGLGAPARLRCELH